MRIIVIRDPFCTHIILSDYRKTRFYLQIIDEKASQSHTQPNRWKKTEDYVEKYGGCDGTVDVRCVFEVVVIVPPACQDPDQVNTDAKHQQTKQYWYSA